MGKWIHGANKQPCKCKTMSNNIISFFISTITTSTFMGSIISNCLAVCIITIIPEGGIIAHEQQKSKLNTKLFVMYCGIHDIWDKGTIEIDESFICMIAENLSCEKDDSKLNTIEEAMCCFNWLKWKVAIEEYASLLKRQVFGPIIYNLFSNS